MHVAHLMLSSGASVNFRLRGVPFFYVKVRSVHTCMCLQTGNPTHRRSVVAFIGFCIYSLGNGLLILALGRFENDHPVQTRALPSFTVNKVQVILHDVVKFLTRCCMMCVQGSVG